MSPVIYLDNAATSWPKPPAVTAAMTHYLAAVGASPGRSAHRLALEAGRVVLRARENLAALFHTADPGRIVFTKNATEAINTAIFGCVAPGDRVIVSAVEHNAIMRPLRWLAESARVTLTVLPCDGDGVVDGDALERELRQPARLVAITHASNVTGAINPLDEIGRLVSRSEAKLLVDAAQTAGTIPIDVEAMHIDLLAFPGHKGLLGPTGTGGLYVREGLDLVPLTRGGTGSFSEFEAQPAFLPDALESGTLNGVGIAGLEASTALLLSDGVVAIRGQEMALLAQLLDGLSAIDGVVVYGPADRRIRTGLVSFTVRGKSPADAAMALEDNYSVMCRVGLHCAPAAHRLLGTFPAGTLRFGLGYFNTPAEIDLAVAAVHGVAGR